MFAYHRFCSEASITWCRSTATVHREAAARFLKCWTTERLHPGLGCRNLVYEPIRNEPPAPDAAALIGKNFCLVFPTHLEQCLAHVSWLRKAHRRVFVSNEPVRFEEVRS